jgi:hypothetical protein
MELWVCTKCGHEVYAESKPSFNWSDGHVCTFVSVDYDPDLPEDMDGDHASALASAGWGTDEDYGYYGGDE